MRLSPVVFVTLYLFLGACGLIQTQSPRERAETISARHRERQSQSLHEQRRRAEAHLRASLTESARELLTDEEQDAIFTGRPIVGIATNLDKLRLRGRAMLKVVHSDEGWQEARARWRARILDLSTSWRHSDPSADTIADAVVAEVAGDTDAMVEALRDVFLANGWEWEFRDLRETLHTAYTKGASQLARRIVLITRQLEREHGDDEDAIQREADDQIGDEFKLSA